MFNRLPGIGIDIGSKRIKLAWVKRKRDGLQIVKYGSIPTPTDAVDLGVIADPEKLGDELGVLVRDLKLKGKRVVSAVGGQQVYIRNLIMPSMKLNELKEAVYYQATNFLPIPIEEASTDIFPLRNFEDEEGKKTEVFFLAVRRQQVKNLEIACQVAGLKLAAVEIEPLSIYRVLGRENASTIALIAMSSSRSYFTVFKRGIPVFYRSLSSGRYAFLKTLEINNETNGSEEIDVTDNNNQYDNLVREIISEVSASVDFYEAQKEMEDEMIEKFLLCGTGAVKGLDIRLTAGLGREVEVANILNRLLLPWNMSETEKHELQYDFPVALGLAAREVV